VTTSHLLILSNTIFFFYL